MSNGKRLAFFVATTLLAFLSGMAADSAGGPVWFVQALWPLIWLLGGIIQLLIEVIYAIGAQRQATHTLVNAMIIALASPEVAKLDLPSDPEKLKAIEKSLRGTDAATSKLQAEFEANVIARSNGFKGKFAE